MTIVAKTRPGQEYCYNVLSAHRINKAHKHNICESLNKAGYSLIPGEIWHTYEISIYDAAFDVAKNQYMRVTNGQIKISSMYM